MQTTWHHNHVPRHADGTVITKQNPDVDMSDRDLLSRKRLNFEIVPAGPSTLNELAGRVAAIVGQLHLTNTRENTPPGESTPEKSQPPNIHVWEMMTETL